MSAANRLQNGLDVIAAELAEAVAQQVAQLLHDQPSPHTEAASPWLTFKQACDYLGFSRDTLYKLTAAGAIPYRKKAGGQRRALPPRRA